MTLITHTLGWRKPWWNFFQILLNLQRTEYWWVSSIKPSVLNWAKITFFLIILHVRTTDELFVIIFCVLLILVVKIKKLNSLEFKCSTCWLYYKAPASKCLSQITLQHVLFLPFPSSLFIFSFLCFFLSSFPSPLLSVSLHISCLSH